MTTLIRLARFHAFVLLLAAAATAFAQPDAGIECRFWSKPYARTFLLRGGYKLKMTHVEPVKEIGCHAEVLSPKGETLFRDEEWDISLDQKDLDINRDGRADLVLRGYSGGSHCCWTYWIITPSMRPALQWKIENQAHVQFVDLNHDGTITLVAQEGGFDYFDGLCHACSVLPFLYFRIRGHALVDVSSDYRSRYDDEIKAARFKLIHEPLQHFIAARNEQELSNAAENVKPLVLTVVLAYLYSGREDQARKALEEMWPPFDQQRIRKLILETRTKGLLRYVGK
jgi:hypothetical protein